MTTDRQRWLEWRRQGIGGSDAAAICGLSPFSSATAVWLSKVTPLILPDDGDEPMRWGKRLEPAIADEFEDKSGLIVTNRQDLVVHPTKPFMRATIDGLVREPTEDDPNDPKNHLLLGIYEAKSASRRSSDWDDGVPEHIQIQVQHNMAVTNLDRAWVAALLMAPIPHLVIHVVERDDAAILVLEQMEEEFWDRVQRREPPPLDASERTTEALRRAFAPNEQLVCVLDDDQASLVRAWLDAKALELDAGRSRTLLENQIMALMGEATVATYNDKTVVTWQPYQQERIDSDALRAKHPRIAKEVTKTTTGRRFIVKSRPEENE